MPISIRAAGALRPATSIRIMIGGTLRAVKAIRVRQGNQLRPVYSTTSPISLSLSPPDAYGEMFTQQPAPVTSEPVTAMVSGGRGPFTYQWSVDQAIDITSPNSASTTFVRVVYGGTIQGAMSCTVTGADGSQATATGSVYLTNNGGMLP